MRKVPYDTKRRHKCEYCTDFHDGCCKWSKCHYLPERREYHGYPFEAIFARVAR